MKSNIGAILKSSTAEMNLNSQADGVYVQPDLEGLTGLPEIRSSVGVNAGEDGGWTSAQLLDARLISLRLVIANEDIAKVESLRQKLNSILSQGLKEELELTVTTEAGNSYTVLVRTSSVDASLGSVPQKQEFLIQFRADDPLIYGASESGGIEAILRVQQALGGFEIPFTFPLAIGGGLAGTIVENIGSETVYPVITLYGPLHSPTVVNQTTNQQMQILADLTEDDVVVIDSMLKTITLNGLDVYHLKSESSTFITIAPGNNTMVLTSALAADEGRAEVSYKQGYLSI